MSKTRSVAAMILIAAGVAFMILGLVKLQAGGHLAALLHSLTATVPADTPAPTLTEPILPPPPTATPSTSAPAPTHTAMPAPALRLSPSATPSTVPATVQPAAATLTPAPTHTPTGTSAPAASPPPPTGSGLYTLRQRVGVCGAASARDSASRLGFGWYLDWHAGPDHFHSAAVEYMPMIRLQDGIVQPSGEALLAAVDALPGALWLIGNEPDVRWQDNVTPEVYAEAYHDLYALLKARDPTCQVAIGGVSQPTPLRMRYLERILDTYQARYNAPMPVDVWNVHNFILREERDSWGVDIPPGLGAQTGVLHEIADHDNLAIFRQQIVAFRQWMAEHGQQHKPLIVTEYGILMPAEYGFPADRVTDFLLRTFEFFRTATDPAFGYPADGYRLVQRWCWFSTIDDRYPTGNLVEAGSGELTPLGEAFHTYLQSAE
ncbi:MAG: hypothetical protein JXA93_22120 [Anaerolineae bacterium]|nr:hypothetical protein [Anaerolineae bacterium]